METFCYLCSDTQKIECQSCHGKGLVGGFLGIGARACPMCSGAGWVRCPDCEGELGNLMRPDTGPSMSQSVMTLLESLEDSRPVILPPDPCGVPGAAGDEPIPASAVPPLRSPPTGSGQVR